MNRPECSNPKCSEPATHVATEHEKTRDVCEGCAMQMFEWGWDVRKKEEGEP